MSCERYREKISDALAGGAVALSENVAAHVRACGGCREFYEAQKHLFGAVDTGVRAMVNEAVPASLLAGVRARMEEAQMARFLLPWKAPAVAAIVLVMLIAFPLLRNSYRMKDGPPVVVAENQNSGGESELRVPVQPAESNMPVIQEYRTAPRIAERPSAKESTAAAEATVIFNPEEVRGLRRLAEAVREDPQWAMAMTQRLELPAGEQEAIQPIKIPDLEMKPLSFENE